MPGEEIPQAVKAPIAFLQRSDVPAEWTAFTASFLLPRIHAFRGGNGHCTRMLSLAILAPRYCPEQLLAFLARMQANRMRRHATRVGLRRA